MKTIGYACIAWTCLGQMAGLTWGQFPSATYNATTGHMTVDSGGIDLVAVFIEGPDVSNNMGCNLCDGMNLPGEDALAGASTWTLGFINGSSQWIRTNPLTGRGFVGVIADSYVDGGGVTQPWPDDVPPFLDFPEAGLGIATYAMGLGADDFGLVTFASDDGSVIQTPVVCCAPFPPFARDDEYVATLGTMLEVPAPGVLANDLDPNGGDLTAALEIDPIYGDVIVNTDGSFTYTAPPIGAVSPGTIDTFSYLAIDTFLATDQATVSITLVPEPRQSFWVVTLLVLGTRFRACRHRVW